MKFKSRTILFMLIFLLAIAMLPTVVSAKSSAQTTYGPYACNNSAGQCEMLSPHIQDLLKSGEIILNTGGGWYYSPTDIFAPPPPETDPYTYLDSMQEIHHINVHEATVTMQPGAISEGVFVTVEGFDHPPQDSNGVWSLTSLVALNVNGGTLNTPTTICFPIGDLPSTASMASWMAGPNGGVFTPVPTSRWGDYLCTSTSRTGTFGLVDLGYYN